LALGGLLGTLVHETGSSPVSALVRYMDGSFSKKDGQDVIGHVFGLGAIVSGDERVFGALTAEDVGGLVGSLVGLMGQKSFVREASGEVLVALAYRLSEGQSDGSLLGAYFRCEGLVDVLHGQAGNAGHESHDRPSASSASASRASYDGMVVGLAMQLWPWMPKEVVGGCRVLAGDARPGVGVMFPAGGTKKHDASQAGDKNDNDNDNDGRVVKAFFGRQHLEANVRPYLKATTSSHPHMHGCWWGMLRLLARGRGAVQEDTHASLKHFWDVLVEGDLFDSQSHEKKYLGMMIFEELLPMVDAAGLKLLMTQKFVRCLGNNANNKQTYLNKASAQAVAALREKLGGLAGEDAAEIVAGVERFGGGQLAHTFASDVPSGSGPQVKEKTEGMMAEIVEMLNNARTAGGDASYLFHLSKVPGIVKKHQNDPRACEQLFKGLVDVYVHTARAGGGGEAAGEQENVPVKVLGALLNGIGSLSKAHASIEELVSVEVSLLEHIGGLDLEGLPGRPTPALTALREAVWRAKRAGSKKGKSSSNDDAKKIHHFLHLVCLLELYSFVNPETSDDEMADDLQSVFNECFAAKQKPKKNDTDEEVDEDDEPVFWADVLVDCVLSVVSRNETPYPSAPLRDAGELLFRYFSADVTRQGLASLFEILVQSLDGAANQAREDGDDEDEGMMAVEDGGEDSADDEDDDNDDDDDDDDDDTEMHDVDGDDVDADADDRDPMDATDEQMFKMDSMLGAYFASHQVKSKKQLRDDLINFKLRVMSCLEIFMRLHPDSPLLLEAPDPLLTSLSAVSRPDGSQVLQERLTGLIKNKLSKCRCHENIDAFVAVVDGGTVKVGSDDGGSDGDAAKAESPIAQVISSQLRRCLYLASRTPVKLVAEAATHAYAYLQRSLHHLGDDTSSLVSIANDSLQAALEDFFTKKKSKLTKAFFPDLFKKCPSLVPTAFPTLIDRATNARSPYLQNEAVLLLGAAMHMIDDDEARALFADNDEATKAMLGEGAGKRGGNKAVEKVLAAMRALTS